MVRLSTPDTEELTAELDGATEWLGVPSDELLLAALARTIAKTLGDGIVPVDVASERGSMLDAVPLLCATAQQADATEVLRGVHHVLASATESTADGMSEMYFNYLGEVPEDSVPVPFRKRRPGWDTRWSCGSTAPKVWCTSTGGTTRAVSRRTPSKSSPSSSRARSTR